MTVIPPCGHLYCAGDCLTCIAAAPAAPRFDASNNTHPGAVPADLQEAREAFLDAVEAAAQAEPPPEPLPEPPPLDIPRPVRRRWVFTQGGEPLPEPIEVTPDWENTPGRAWTPTEELLYGGARATDGTPINTRKRHREYMRENALTTADDFKETWTQERQRRDAERCGDFGVVENRRRRDTVGRAMYELEKKRSR